MRSVESFELDESCILLEVLEEHELRFDQTLRLTDLRVSFHSFNQCVHLLNQLGSQLHSFKVTFELIYEAEPRISPEITSVSEMF